MSTKASLRPLAAPIVVRVQTDGRGRPLAVVMPDPRGRRRMGEPRLIEVILESWRIDDEWWRRPISRLYHEVVLETGGTLVLYRDLVGGGWYVHGGGGPTGPARGRRTRPGGDG
jgi:hypothetical protein